MRLLSSALRVGKRLSGARAKDRRSWFAPKLLVLVAGAAALAVVAAVVADDKPTDNKKPAAPPATTTKLAAAPPVKPTEKLPPVKGSHIPDDTNSCVQCHTNADVFGDPKDKEHFHLFIPMEGLKKDVHYLKGVNCSDCHGGNPESTEPNQAHASEDFFRSKKADVIANRCVYCHQAEKIALGGSVHAKAVETSDPQRRTVLACDQCHGKLAHSLLPVKDPKSPVHLKGQIEHCGGCHGEELKTFLASVHGQAIKKKGLSTGQPGGPPGCATCHGSHNIDATERSLRPTSPTQCGECHEGIGDLLRESIHGKGGIGGLADRPAPGGKTRQKPTCISCHEGHALESPSSAAFREAEPGHCGNCHGSMSNLYAMSMHGKLTNLGYAPAAKCADCHGSHDIQPPDDAALQALSRQPAAYLRPVPRQCPRKLLAL